MHYIDEQVSVSGQIDVDDISTLKTDNVTLIICNRPDNESQGQPLFSDIAKAAQSQGIACENLPFSGGDMSDAQVAEFAKLLKQHARIHAYCRSGNRSSVIWERAKSL